MRCTIEKLLYWLGNHEFKGRAWIDCINSGVYGHYIGHKRVTIVFNNGIIAYLYDNTDNQYSINRDDWFVMTSYLPNRCIKDDKVIKQIR